MVNSRRNEMTELKEKALAKMLEEMNTPHDGVLDYIHNILCDSEDEELFAGILVEGKSIANAFNKMADLAKKAAKNGMAFFSPEEGMRIVIDYFKGNETEVKPIIGMKSGTTQSKPSVETADHVIKRTEAIIKKHEAQKKTDKPEVLMNIFDFMDQPGPAKDPADFDPSDEAMREMSNQPDPEIEDDIEETEDAEND